MKDAIRAAVNDETERLKQLAEFDETLSERFKEPSRSLMSKDFFETFREGARYQHAQSAKLIELLLKIVSVQGEALEVMAEKHYLGMKAGSRTAENPYGEMIRDETCEAAVAKVRALVEGFEP